MRISRLYIFITVLLCFITVLCACAQDSETTTVPPVSEYARVNGEIITLAEAEYFEKKYRAEIISDYLAEYTMQYSDSFWDTEINGTSPQYALEERVLSEAVSAKIRLVLMRDNGIYEDISFAALYAKAEVFNRECESGQNRIGLKSIPLDSFYTYYIQTGDMQLEQLLGKTILKPTEQEIEKYAESLGGVTESISESDARSIAIDALVSEKYEKYIAQLIEKATVELIQAEN